MDPGPLRTYPLTPGLVGDISDCVSRALLSMGARPLAIQVQPLDAIGLLVSARIADQIVSTVIPAGLTILWEGIARALIDQLDPVNIGLPTVSDS